MKRFEFRLASVLRARRTAEERAKSELALANRALREAIGSRDAERARASSLTPDNGIEPFNAFHARALRGSLAAHAHAAAQARVAEMAAAAAMAQLAWAGAAREVAVLERLAERRREEHRAAEQIADASALDDLVNARYAFDHAQQVPGGVR